MLAQTRWDRPWRTYVFQVCFLALLVAVIILPNPFVESWPIQTRLRFGNFVYVLLFLDADRADLSAAGDDLGRAVRGARLGDRRRLGRRATGEQDLLEPRIASRRWAAPRLLALFLDPYFVYVEGHIQDVVIVLLMAGVLALVVWRSRRLVLSQIGLARERANLARYFAPTVVDQLAQLDAPLGATRMQPVAVLFADIVGFTRFAESSDPQTVVATLRQFHGRLERAMFDQGGTLDKFSGRRHHGDLRHAAVSDRTTRATRSPPRSRPAPRSGAGMPSAPRAASRRSLSRSASTTGRWCSATSARSVGWSSPCWAMWSMSRSAWKG